VASTGEQSSSGLLAETEATRRIASLNERYRERFGHPFILAVRGLGPDEILATFEARLQRSPEEEFSECLHQIGRIARFRLEDRFTSAG
jgi:2-oxo-4-hydroxy-4-carboxy--5-ureidoimidazoline (OHCU) decarboxylase